MQRRISNLASLLFLLAALTVEAQTLNQQISRGATFFQPADPFDQYSKMMNAQAQAEQAATQRRLAEEQIRAMQLENQKREEAVKQAQRPQPLVESPPHVTAWFRAAQPRMHLYPDFQQVVFSQDLAISDDMIKMMASSPLAADIAYYLGTNKMESVAIKSMPFLDAARAISDIEKRLIQSANK